LKGDWYSGLPKVKVWATPGKPEIWGRTLRQKKKGFAIERT